MPDASSLSLKRQEIIQLISEQKIVTFEYLARNFRGITPRTLHYDLSQLVKAGFIRKLGATRGVQYQAV